MSQVAILLIIGVVVAANGSKLFVASSLLAIPVVILHNLCGYALGFGFSKLMYKVYPKGFRYAQQKAITFEVGMQDSALGATLALSSFASNPLAAVPSTFFSVWHNISGSVLSSWWREHDDKHQIHRIPTMARRVPRPRLRKPGTPSRMSPRKRSTPECDSWHRSGSL